jgi:hypothetical protein
MDDISIKYGSLETIGFDITTDVDLSGFTLLFQVKRTKDSDVVLMEKEVEIDAEELTADIELSASDWDLIPNKTMDYEYGTRIYKDGVFDRPWLQGKFKVEIAVAVS